MVKGYDELTDGKSKVMAAEILYKYRYDNLGEVYVGSFRDSTENLTFDLAIKHVKQSIRGLRATLIAVEIVK